MSPGAPSGPLAERPVAVAILGSGRTALGVVQALGQAGIRSRVLDRRRGLAGRSRFARFLRIPGPSHGDPGPCLQALGRVGPGRPVLLATTDEWALFMARHRDRLAEGAQLAAPPADSVELLLDKERFAREGARRGWPVPAVHDATGFDGLSPDAFPLCAKPRARRAGSLSHPLARPLARRLDRLRLVRLDSPSELDTFIAREGELLDHLSFQAWIPGNAASMITVGIAADASGQVLEIFTGRKVRGYPAGFGDCIVGHACEVPGFCVETAVRIARELRLAGVSEFEFRDPEGGGAPVLIEVNPRPWSWIGATRPAGRNLLVRYLQGSEGPPAASTPQRSVTWVRLVPDAWNCWVRYRRDGEGWPLGPRAWISDLRARRPLLIAEWGGGDPLPFVQQTLGELLRIARKEVRRAFGRPRPERSQPGVRGNRA